MPNQIVHQANKVTYKWTFNQDVESGMFWDGSPYVINKAGLKLIDMEMETEFGVEKPNTVISDLELGKNGFKGELYINGLVKNPRGLDDYSPTGQVRNKGNQFDSRSFGCYNKGWTPYKKQLINGKWVNVLLPTNSDAAYKGFNLTKFLETKSQFENGGIDIEFGDVLVVQWSNFDLNCSYKWDISSSAGYPYQRVQNRSCSMSYGTLFVLDKHPAEICFRPPVLWPEEDRQNRPIHAISKLNNKLPDASELVENPFPKSKIPTYAGDPTFKTFCYGFPFGNGTSYSQSMPIYAGSTESYGAYFQEPLMIRLQTLYSKEVPDAQRFENFKSVIQWGIDAFGSIKTYACTSSGAGQRPCAARPWSIISGHFLDEIAMKMPETTMISDTARSTGLLLNKGAGVDGEDGETAISGTDEQMKMIYGDPYTNLTSKKRWHSTQISLEANCYYKVVNEAGNVLDYRTLGKTHRRTFSAVGANLQETTEDQKYGLIPTYNNASSFSGKFAKIQWDVGPEDLHNNWAATHDGKASTFWYSYIKVISGPGAGDTLYRIIKSWGEFRNLKPETSQNVSGFGFILDKPWKNGQPDQTSVFEMITCTEQNVGEIFYLIGATRFNGMADANLSPQTPYGGICEKLVVKLYGWMNYIEKKTGVNPDLDKDATFVHEYVQRILSNSPYEWVTYSTAYHAMGCYSWDAAILNKWYYRPGTPVEIAKTINWKTIPGIKTWCGVDVSTFENKLIGDFNNDGIVDAMDQGMLLAKWGTNDSDYDLDGDGIVDAKDLAIFLNQFGKTTDNP